MDKVLGHRPAAKPAAFERFPVAAAGPGQERNADHRYTRSDQYPTNLNIYTPGVSRSNTGLHQLIYEYFFYQNLQTGE